MASTYYTQLWELLDEARLFDRQPRYYAGVIGASCSGLFLCLYLLASVKDPIWLGVVAALYGFVTIQLGFVMHDAGHQAVFGRGWLNDLLGLFVGDLLSGVSYGWWAPHHARHHAHPNSLDHDPDLPMLQVVFAVSEDDARSRQGVRRLMARYQAYLVPVVFPLQSFALKYHGLRFLLLEKSRFRGVELVLLAVHYTSYSWFLLHFLGPWPALEVLLIQHLVGGAHLSTVLAPNHMGMEVIPDSVADPFLRQVRPSRNVRTPWQFEFFWGSLNHQIEHHLFPLMSRNQIRRAVPLVRQFCLDRGVEYHEMSFGRCYREIFSSLERFSSAASAGGGGNVRNSGLLRD